MAVNWSITERNGRSFVRIFSKRGSVIDPETWDSSIGGCTNSPRFGGRTSARKASADLLRAITEATNQGSAAHIAYFYVDADTAVALVLEGVLTEGDLEESVYMAGQLVSSVTLTDGVGDRSEYVLVIGEHAPGNTVEMLDPNYQMLV